MVCVFTGVVNIFNPCMPIKHTHGEFPVSGFHTKQEPSLGYEARLGYEACTKAESVTQQSQFKTS